MCSNTTAYEVVDGVPGRVEDAVIEGHRDHIVDCLVPEAHRPSLGFFGRNLLRHLHPVVPLKSTRRLRGLPTGARGCDPVDRKRGEPVDSTRSSDSTVTPDEHRNVAGPRGTSRSRGDYSFLRRSRPRHRCTQRVDRGREVRWRGTHRCAKQRGVPFRGHSQLLTPSSDSLWTAVTVRLDGLTTFLSGHPAGFRPCPCSAVRSVSLDDLRTM